MESHQQIVLRMFGAMSSGIPFQQQWKGDLRRLRNVGVSYIEGQTLLQHAVIQGRRDWVNALLASGADVSCYSGQTTLELAREMLTEHHGDSQRLAIMEVLEMIVAREGQDGGVRSVERFPPFPVNLNLQWLEDYLGVKLETCGERVKLPANVLQRLNTTLDRHGNSLPMWAAIEGNFECVDLLLRCGAQVNASRTIDGEEQRAIDFAVEGGHKSIVKLLLQWDSLMPHSYEEDPVDWLTSMAREDQEIEELLQRRDEFHEKVRKGDVAGIREMVSSGEGNDDSCGHPRYWVNREGRSALRTAVYHGQIGVLTLLKRLNFDCLEDEKFKVERELEGDINKCREYNSALVHNVEPIKDRHVLIMMLKSLMRKGGVETDGGDFIREVYEAANKVPVARVLMRCLRHEPDLEVIFDKEKTDISCMYLPSGPGVPGAYDSSVHRVYASAALDTLSDTVSNLVHELAHTVLHVVFENEGLPYSKGDQERKETYNKIVSNILSQENITNCNIIIQRVRFYPEDYYPHEVIVRVPEIITKLELERDDGESSEPWCNDNEKELFHFYHECVEKDILSWIKPNLKNNACDFLSRHVRDSIEIGNICVPCQIQHSNIPYLQVSNMALGVSHVKKSLRDIVCVDWATFLKKRKPLEINLMRRNISHVAVVWDEGMGSQFCEQSQKCSEDCPAYKFSSLKEYVTFIVPKYFIVPGGNHPLEYKWEHLSSKTKDWILERKVEFQGRDVTLKVVIDFVREGNDVESIMSSITDSDVITWLIDEEKMLNFGSELKSLWGMRGDDFKRNHPEICIERTTKMRKIDLKGVILRRRDAFFFINAKESDLREMNVGTVSYWNSENVPEGANCFRLEEHLQPQSEIELCDRICEEICHSGKEWPYAHFFRFSQGKHTHVLSHCMADNRCRLLADEPGCGKTVFVYDAARKEKENHPERWTEVVELSKCEKVLERCKKNNYEDNESAEDFLYDLITVNVTESQQASMKMVRKLFNHFCQSKEKASLYLDGFDEICPKYKNKCSSLLSNLREKSKVNVLVTSKTNQIELLEEILSTFSTHFVPFDREQQIHYLNEVWNALLKSVADPKRADKLQSVISNVRARSFSGEKYGEVIENLKRHSEDPSVDVDFTEVAKEVTGMYKSSVEGEGYLSGVPFHAWMIASVYFEDNFRLPQPLELSHLYTRFVTAKLKEYCYGRVEFTGHQAKEVFLKSVMEFMRQNLKKFSASFFLGDQKYKPEDEHLVNLARAGLLIEKSGVFDLIHITFGEIFFSVWILEEAKKNYVTRILLKGVLLDIKFKKVRKFIDEILLPSDQNTSENYGECICKITEPSKVAFDKDYEVSKLFRNCFHRAVSSCHLGIIRYLAKSWKERLADALFSMRVCHCGEATEKCNDRKERHNAFIIGDHFSVDSSYLETIHTLLTLTEENGLIDKLKDFICECGLKWAGINEKELWENEECRKWLLRIIDFLRQRSDILRNAIGVKILRKDHLEFLKQLSLFSFNEFKLFLNSIVGENCFRKLLVPSLWNFHLLKYSPMTDVWFFTVMKGSVENVSEMWDLIKSNLRTKKERKAFLLRKDEDGRNCLFSSILFNSNFQVVKFLWEQYESEFRREKLEKFIFKTFESNMFYGYSFAYQSAKNMTDWLSHLTAEDVISFKYSVALLRKIRVHKFTIGGWFPVQDFLMAAGGDEEARGEVEEFLAVEGIKGFECPLYVLDDDYVLSSEFRSIVGGEWERILPALLPHLPTRPVSLDENAWIRDQIGLTGGHVTTMATYLLFAWRQFELISEYLTGSDLKQSALRNYFGGIFDSINTRIGPESVPFVFSVPTAFFSKKQIIEAFLESNFFQRIADLKTDDMFYASKFLAAYDVTRLCLGEDALWVVHSITIGWRHKPLVEVLLKKQEEGIF